jgi:hypothetical protein
MSERARHFRRWPSTWSRPSTIAFFVACAVLTILFVGPFLAHSPFGGFDWPKERFFYTTLRLHLRTHGAPPAAFLGVPPSMLPPVRYMPTLMHSSSYVGNPEVLTFSPLLPLLALVSVELFLRIYFAAHLLVAAIGLCLLARRLAVPPWAALLLFALTILNPWLVQHLAIGYSPYITITLCPLVLAMLSGSRLSVADWIVGSATEALIIYEGGLHIFNWLNGALLVFALVMRSRSLLFRVGAVLGGAVLLAAPKLVAVAATFGGWHRDPLSGVRRLADIYGLLTDGHTNPFKLPQAYGVYSTNLYDGAMYVGVPFVLLMIAALLVVAWRRQRYGAALAAVAAVFGVLAWRSVWPSLARAVPLAATELYPYRFLFLSLTALTALVVLETAALVARGGLARWLPLLFIPTLCATWARTQDYASLTRTPIAADCTPQTLDAAIPAQPPVWSEDHRPLPATYARGGITIQTNGARTLVIPDLRAAQVSDFDVEGGRIVQADWKSGVRLSATAATVRLVPRTHHFWAVALATWLAFALIAWLTAWRRRR